MKFLVFLLVLMGCSTADAGEYKTGLILPKNWSKQVYMANPPMMLQLPEKFDWRESRTLSPIKDQGSCGSCYTFSTVATLQDAQIAKKAILQTYSEQYLLNCNKQNWGCDGGFFLHDMHMRPGGAVRQSDMPYLGRKTRCDNSKYKFPEVASWAYIPGGTDTTPPSVEQIKSAIYSYGPISVGVAADDSFSRYKTGIFSNCRSRQPNHAVNLVGWGPGYWIMKNSWGTRWGDRGYMKIRWGCNAIGVAANYVILRK